MVEPENKLTARQEKFCQCIADGKTQIASYKAAYNAKKQTRRAIDVSASRLAANAKILLRIGELQSKLVQKKLWTRQQSIGILKKIASSVKKETRNADKIAATRELNLMHGFNSTSGDLDSYVLPVNVTIQVKNAKRKG